MTTTTTISTYAVILTDGRRFNIAGAAPGAVRRAGNEWFGTVADMFLTAEPAGAYVSADGRLHLFTPDGVRYALRSLVGADGAPTPAARALNLGAARAAGSALGVRLPGLSHAAYAYLAARIDGPAGPSADGAAG